MVQKWYFWSKRGICASKGVYLDEKCIFGPNIWIFGPKMVSWSKNDIFGPKMISLVQKWYFWPPPMLSKQIMLDSRILDYAYKLGTIPYPTHRNNLT